MKAESKTAVRLLAATMLSALLIACGTNEADGVSAVFVNGGVYTVDGNGSRVEAVAIDDDRIVFVGSNEGAQRLIGRETVMHDLQGRMLLPGFIDTHMHPISGGAYARALSLDTFGEVTDWVAAIEAYARENPDAPLIFGYGFLASTFGPQGPTRQLIDAVVPDRPVLIMDEGFHGAWANTAALEALNITADTPDPVPGFSYYKRDADGNATGYLLEGTASIAMDGLNAITRETIVDGTAYVFDVLNYYGVTSIYDAGASGYENELDLILEELEDRGDMTVRIVGSYRPGGAEDVDIAVDKAVSWRDRIRGERYHYRNLKIMDDGTVEGRTGAMFEDYQGEPGNSGETVFTEEQLTTMIGGAAGKNIDVHVHALGERAIHETLNAIENSRALHPDSNTRYTICHVQVIADQDVPRFEELDVIAQSTPLWASYDTHGKQFVSEDQFRRFWRFNSLKEAGARLTFGSDFPASGAGMLGMSPVLQIEIGHTRQAPGQPDAPVQPRRSERLDIATLIRGFTRNAAWQLHMEDEIGSIAVGKKADLVVLDQDLFAIDPYSIHKTRALLTVLDGEVVWQAEDY